MQNNKPVHITVALQVNYLIIPFEGNINPGEQYLQETRYTEKNTDKLDTSVSNAEYIINHFLNLAKNMVGEDLNSW